MTSTALAGVQRCWTRAAARLEREAPAVLSVRTAANLRPRGRKLVVGDEHLQSVAGLTSSSNLRALTDVGQVAEYPVDIRASACLASIPDAGPNPRDRLACPVPRVPNRRALVPQSKSVPDADCGTSAGRAGIAARVQRVERVVARGEPGAGERMISTTGVRSRACTPATSDLPTHVRALSAAGLGGCGGHPDRPD